MEEVKKTSSFWSIPLSTIIIWELIICSVIALVIDRELTLVGRVISVSIIWILILLPWNSYDINRIHSKLKHTFSINVGFVIFLLTCFAYIFLLRTIVDGDLSIPHQPITILAIWFLVIGVRKFVRGISMNVFWEDYLEEKENKS